MRRALPTVLRRGAAVAVLAGIAAFAAVSMGAGAASAATDPAPEGIGLTVTVGPGGATSSPAPVPPASRPSTTTSTNVGGSVVVNDPLNPPAPTDDEYSIGGVLYVSGLSTEYLPSIDPLGGELKTWFTVRNVSTGELSGSARFWVSSPFGTELSAQDDVELSGLKPQESKVVSATLTGVGQYTFATAHYTFTPPESVDGVALTPVTRDAFVVLPPWFLLGTAALAGLAFVVVQLVRAMRVPALTESAA
ncbi:hypothetical protein [Herbiconiux sp.]|jgi:hypothetical protein|uniref:hypothetical protein n=1 Tax=Herbiconiux sp. TaxID=1871186 RepID=UPI0025C60246|nr:hypothetical protein [Herbiconiux sp.]